MAKPMKGGRGKVGSAKSLNFINFFGGTTGVGYSPFMGSIVPEGQ